MPKEVRLEKIWRIIGVLHLRKTKSWKETHEKKYMKYKLHVKWLKIGGNWWKIQKIGVCWEKWEKIGTWRPVLLAFFCQTFGKGV